MPMRRNGWRRLVQALAHLGMGVAVWAWLGYATTAVAIFTWWAGGFFRGADGVGGVPEMGDMGNAVLVLLAGLGLVTPRYLLLGAVVGLLVAVVTLPLAGRPPKIGPRVLGSATAMAVLAWELLVRGGVPRGDFGVWHLYLFALAGVGGWIVTPWLWLRPHRFGRRSDSQQG